MGTVGIADNALHTIAVCDAGLKLKSHADTHT